MNDDRHAPPGIPADGVQGGADSREAIAAELHEWCGLRRGVPTDAEFNRLALAVFRYQRRNSEPYRLLCEVQGVQEDADDPGRVPFVPADAFKHYRLACFPPSDREVRFHTSGTTSGRPGVHVLPDTTIYDAAAMPWLARHLLSPETKYRFLSLTLPPESAPHSSLVHMIETAGRTFGRVELRGGGRAVDYFFGESGPDLCGLASAANRAADEGEPVVLFTTAFALVRLVDSLGEQGHVLALPPGSRIMETGGFKGRSRTVERRELYDMVSERLAIPVRSIVNEYGMTEMSSQFYDRTLSHPDEPEEEARVKVSPPWVRSLVVDPVTFEPVGEGETGLLLHIDLANLDSCAFLMTADAGVRRGAGFDLLGRMADAVPRGCSLDYEDVAG